MKKIACLVLVIAVIAGCKAATVATKPVTHEVMIRVESQNDSTVTVREDTIHKAMEIPYETGQLSNNAFLIKDEGYMQLWGSIQFNADNYCNDLIVLREKHKVQKVKLYINSGGGGAFDGMAIADELQRTKHAGVEISAYASGIVGSAAVPIFAVCSKRYAAPGTMFMVHQARLSKWYTVESEDDIKKQVEMFEMLKNSYIGKLAQNSALSIEEWESKIDELTWFTPEQAKAWGLVDEIQ